MDWIIFVLRQAMKEAQKTLDKALDIEAEQQEENKGRM